jgi:hypothetical protein
MLLPPMFITALLATVTALADERVPPLVQLIAPLTARNPVKVEPFKFKMPFVPTVLAFPTDKLKAPTLSVCVPALAPSTRFAIVTLLLIVTV